MLCTQEKNSGETGLMLAIQSGYIEMVKLLIEHGVDVNHVKEVSILNCMHSTNEEYHPIFISLNFTVIPFPYSYGLLILCRRIILPWQWLLKLNTQRFLSYCWRMELLLILKTRSV